MKSEVISLRMASEHRILLWMCVLVGINQLGFGAMVPSLALYAQSFGVPASAIGLAVGIYGLARFATAVPAGQLSDWIGRRPTLAIGGLVSALGNLWCARAGHYPEFIVARFIAGAGAGLILTTGQVVLADISTPARRARTISIYQGTFLFAVGLGPLPGGFLGQRVGLAAPFVAYAAAGSLAAVVAWRRLPETKDRRLPVVPGAASPLPPFTSQLRLLAGRVGFVLVSLVSFVNAVARTGALFNVIPILGHDRLALAPDRIGASLALGNLAGFGLAYPSGVLVDRYGRKSVIVPATLVMGVALVVFLLAPSYPWFLAACAVWGVSQGVSGAAPAAYAADVAPPGMNAAAMSFYRMLADSGYVVGPVVLGLVTDLTGPETALGVGAALLVVVATVFAWLAPESYQSHAGR